MTRVNSRDFLAGALLTALVLVLLFVPVVNGATGAESGVTGSSTASGNARVPTPGAGGLTVGGVRCAPGVRQVPWSAYAPECVPAWHGENGGATAPGVTGTTITVDYRQFSSTKLNELYSFLPRAIIGTNEEAIAVLKADINVFNHYFELYGRHVVLKVFTGQGDLIQEVTGGGQPEAEADAVQARSLGSFADLSLADTSQFYVNALANNGVISFPLVYQLDAHSYLSEEPYVYTQGPDCTKSNLGLTATIANGMAGMPAIYAGDGALQSRTRSFGIIYNDTPYSHVCEQELADDLTRRGITPAVIQSYSFNPASITQELSTDVEQMQADGVTTIIVPDEDPVTPGLIMANAQADGYHPEWVLSPSFIGGNIEADAIQRVFAAEAPQEMDHTIEPGLVSRPVTSQEDYTTFEKGDPGGTPLPAYSLSWFYAPAILLFSAIQMAGPDLTPQTFQRAFHSLTASGPEGMFGPWRFGPRSADPSSGFQLVHWDPTALSDQDGLPGALLACNGGTTYSYSGAGSEIPARRQIDCAARG